MAMTPEQFEEKMTAIKSDSELDIEESHCKADDLMCELLKELGYAEGVTVFELMYKWYA